MLVGIQNAAATSEKTKDPGLRKGKTGSQTLDQCLLPKALTAMTMSMSQGTQQQHQHLTALPIHCSCFTVTSSAMFSLSALPG